LLVSIFADRDFVRSSLAAISDLVSFSAVY
jgi:hypothetical protein